MDQPRGGGEWIEVRCQSPTCTAAERGGKVLFEGKSGLVAKRANGGKLVVLGMPVLARCRCGWVWHNPDLPIFDGMASLLRSVLDDVAERKDAQQ